MDHSALDCLGYALNLTILTPFDIRVVEKHVLRARRLLSINTKDARDLPIEGKVYRVPSGVSIEVPDVRTIRGEYISFPDGKDAASAFMADGFYPLKYFAVSGGLSVIMAAEKSFLHRHQYAFFSHTVVSYIARVPHNALALEEAQIIAGLDGIPRTFDPSDADAIEKYKQFFEEFGTHVICHVNYGARYPLKVWASNANKEVNEMFNTNVKAMFNGIPCGGEFDASVKGTPQYKRFSELFQYLLTISGGGAQNSKLANIDAKYDDYTKWMDSIKDKKSNPLSFQVTELWVFMRLAQSDVLRRYADQLRDAFTWIVCHPDVYKTAVTLDIQTDWAEFNLLTPSAIIIPNPDHHYPENNTVASDTRVQWGKENNHDYQRQTLRFFVLNDGSNIDFSISHGSLTTGELLSGKATVTIGENSYTNDLITDDVRNTKLFYNVPVNETPETERNHSKPFPGWNDVLKEHLQVIS